MEVINIFRAFLDMPRNTLIKTLLDLAIMAEPMQ